MYRKVILSIFITLLLSVGVFGALNFWSKKYGFGERVKPYVDPIPDDKDRDGISNEEEKTLGLDPLEFDTDGDTLSDKDERDIWKTDPKKVDTDEDGKRDGMEVVEGTDPLVKNT